jgi:hypothetical protein
LQSGKRIFATTDPVIFIVGRYGIGAKATLGQVSKALRRQKCRSQSSSFLGEWQPLLESRQFFHDLGNIIALNSSRQLPFREQTRPSGNCTKTKQFPDTSIAFQPIEDFAAAGIEKTQPVFSWLGLGNGSHRCAHSKIPTISFCRIAILRAVLSGAKVRVVELRACLHTGSAAIIYLGQPAATRHGQRFLLIVDNSSTTDRAN